MLTSNSYFKLFKIKIILEVISHRERHYAFPFAFFKNERIFVVGAICFQKTN